MDIRSGYRRPTPQTAFWKIRLLLCFWIAQGFGLLHVRFKPRLLFELLLLHLGTPGWCARRPRHSLLRDSRHRGLFRKMSVFLLVAESEFAALLRCTENFREGCQQQGAEGTDASDILTTFEQCR